LPKAFSTMEKKGSLYVGILNTIKNISCGLQWGVNKGRKKEKERGTEERWRKKIAESRTIRTIMSD